MRLVSERCYYTCCTTHCRVKDDKIVSEFSQTQQYIILIYLDDDMFRSLDHHQAIITKLRINVHVIWDPIRLTTNVLKYIVNGIR